MKVRELIAQLSEMEQESEICALIYGKELFDYSEEDEVMLTDESWSRIVKEFEYERGIVDTVYEYIQDAVTDYAEERPE